MRDHEIAALVNRLCDIAIQHAHSQQLRQRISEELAVHLSVPPSIDISVRPDQVFRPANPPLLEAFLRVDDEVGLIPPCQSFLPHRWRESKFGKWVSVRVEVGAPNIPWRSK